jgi:hypothetical protein
MKFQYTTTHSFDGENDHDLIITYIYTPPSPARGPTYDCGGEPAGYTEVDVMGVMVDGRASTPTHGTMVIDERAAVRRNGNPRRELPRRRTRRCC